MTKKVCDHWDIEYEQGLVGLEEPSDDEEEEDKWWCKGIPLPARDPTFYGNSDDESSEEEGSSVFLHFRPQVAYVWSLPAAAEEEAARSPAAHHTPARARAASMELPRSTSGGVPKSGRDVRKRERERPGAAAAEEVSPPERHKRWRRGAAAAEEDSPPVRSKRTDVAVDKPSSRRRFFKQIRGSSAEDE